MCACEVTRAESADKREFAGKNRGCDYLGKFLRVIARFLPAARTAEEREAFVLGIQTRSAAYGADLKRGERNRDIDAAFDQIDRRYGIRAFVNMRM